VIDPRYAEQMKKAQQELDLNCPSPEEDIVRLSTAVAFSPETQQYSQIRFLVLEVDNLISQLRWHIGQAFLLLELYPEIAEDREYIDMLEQFAQGNPPPIELSQFHSMLEMPLKSLLLLRGITSRYAHQVLFTDFSQRLKLREGTIAGWIFHMMIDNSIARAISILDRLAKITCLVAGLQIDRVYFRSRILTSISLQLNVSEAETLVKLSESEPYQYLLKYRDGWTHDDMAFARFAGTLPTDVYINPSGKTVQIKGDKWTADTLLVLAQIAYNHVVAALHEVAFICEQKVPMDELGILFKRMKDKINDDL
jgi:hypothetical protein